MDAPSAIVANWNGDAGLSGFHDDSDDISAGVVRLPADQRQDQLMVAFAPARANLSGCSGFTASMITGTVTAGLQQLGRVRLNLKLRDLAALDHHGRNALRRDSDEA